jgi:15-cis-phytoene synthase
MPRQGAKCERLLFVALELDTRMDLYTKVAEETAAAVIRRYSTSFGLASTLLSPVQRTHISNFYALVRLADEIVDGVAEEAGVSSKDARTHLDALEADTENALRTGYSTNLIVHAFAHSARKVGVGSDLTRPFFHSMRMDLTETTHTPESFSEYVYGSAEVVGLMCLEAFLEGQTCTPAERETMVTGARALGAAFQKVNFLRDLGADVQALGRSYFPGVSVQSLSDDIKNELLDDIDRDLAASATALPLLPTGPRRAVSLAHVLFEALATRIRATPAEVLQTTRISVPSFLKAMLATRVVCGYVPRAPRSLRKESNA